MLPVLTLRPFHYRGSEVIGLHTSFQKNTQAKRYQVVLREQPLVRSAKQRILYQAKRLHEWQSHLIDNSSSAEPSATKGSDALLQKEEVSKARAEQLINFPPCPEIECLK